MCLLANDLFKASHDISEENKRTERFSTTEWLQDTVNVSVPRPCVYCVLIESIVYDMPIRIC